MNKWTEDNIRLAIQMFEDDYTYKQVAETLTEKTGVTFSYDSVKHKIKRTLGLEDNKGKTIEQDLPQEKVEHKKDGSIVNTTVIQMKKEEMKDSIKVMKAHGFDPSAWELISATNNFWQQGNQYGKKDLYQSKIMVKPIGMNSKENLQEFMRVFKNSIKPISFKQVNSGVRNLVIPLADMHFGVTTISDLKDKIIDIKEVILKGYETIVIEQLGDLFHSSQINSSQTLRGTLLDDVDMPRAIEDAKLFFDCIIEYCVSNSKKVVVETTCGNHSGNLEYMFLEYLKARYNQVEVKNNASFRTAYQIGRVGIMLTHGDTAKKDLPMLFANEYSDIWSTSTYRELHTGHFHSELVKDHKGVVQRQMGTLKKNDKYEIQNGWTMNKKIIQLLEYDNNRLRVIYEI